MSLLNNPVIGQLHDIRVHPAAAGRHEAPPNVTHEHVSAVNEMLTIRVVRDQCHRLSGLAALNWELSLEVEDCPPDFRDCCLSTLLDVSERDPWLRYSGRSDSIDVELLSSTSVPPSNPHERRAELLALVASIMPTPRNEELLEMALAAASLPGVRAASQFIVHAVLGNLSHRRLDTEAAISHTTAALDLRSLLQGLDLMSVRLVCGQLLRLRGDALIGIGDLGPAHEDLLEAEIAALSLRSELEDMVDDRDLERHRAGRLLIEVWALQAYCIYQEEGQQPAVLHLEDRIRRAPFSSAERGEALRLPLDLIESDGGPSAADAYLEKILAEWGVYTAGTLGHKEAAPLVVAEDYRRVPLIPSELPREATPEELDGYGLVALLNCSETLILRRIREAHEEEKQPGMEEYVHPVRFWQAVLVLQKMARMMLGRRDPKNDDSGSQSHFAVAHRDRSRGRWAIYAAVFPLPKAPEAWVACSSVSNSLLSLRRELAIACTGTERDEQPTIVVEFPGVSDEELRCLKHCLQDEGSLGDRVGGSLWAPQWLSREELPSLLPVDWVLHEWPTSLERETHSDEKTCVIVTDRPEAPPAGSRHQGITAAFQTLLRAAVSGRPAIGYCEMPRGADTYLDYLLGEGPAVQSCCTFFVALRARESCGSSACRRYSSQLVDLQAAKMARAEMIARREFTASSAAGVFSQLWSAACRNPTPDPAIALRDFRAWLKRHQ